MKSSHRRLAARLAFGAAAIALVAIAPLSSAGNKKTTYDQFIVRFKDGTPEHGNSTIRQVVLDDAAIPQGVIVSQQRRLAVGADLVATNRDMTLAEIKTLVGQLRNHPSVEYAELDLTVAPTFVPDDPQYASQWNYSEALAGINVPGAWDTSNGAGEVVAVLDTGITAHSDLAANLVAGRDFITSQNRANDGDGFDADPSDPGDAIAANECGFPHAASVSTWHGTHVAGTVAAVTDNATGVAGVAFGAKVQPVRVLGKCGGVSSDVGDAIVWASGGAVPGVPANPTPASVINLSLGGEGTCLRSTQAAIDMAVANGATVVIAGGNDNGLASGHQPASCRNAITLGAVDRNGARAVYSNHGPAIDLSAPGGGTTHPILSTSNTGTAGAGVETYAGRRGTSMAAAHAAGVAALVRATGATLDAAEMETLLEVTARDFPVACPEGCGAGLLDAGAAVAAAGMPVLTILDADAADEGDAGTSTRTFTVKLSQALAGDVTFDIATVDGTAQAGSDFVARSEAGQVIPAGSTTFDFVVDVTGDGAGEADEAFVVALDNIVGAATVLDDTATTTIVNDDANVLTPNVAVTGLRDDGNGHDRRWTMVVPADALDLKFEVSGGSGDADLYVRHGAEPTETTYDCRPYVLGNAESCAMATQAGTWHVLLDAYDTYDDVTLVGSYALPAGLSINDASSNEGNAGTRVVTFTVTLSHAMPMPVTYDIATANGTAVAGSDYVARTLLTETIPAGQLSKTFAVTVNGDTTIEPNETFTANITNASIGASVVDGTGTGTITNDDGARLSIADTSVIEGNSGQKVMSFTISLTEASASLVTFDVATSDGTALAGSDYVAKSLVGLSIPAGQLSRTFNVLVNGDFALEANEFVRATLSNGSVNIIDQQAQGIILNDDGATLSIADAGFVEGNSGTKTLNFTVSLSQASALPVTFDIFTLDGMAVAGVDFEGKSLTAQVIPAGQLTKTFSITTYGDTDIEGNETLFVRLGNASVLLADGQARGMLINDDGPVLSISDATVTEGDAGTKVMTFTVSLSEMATAKVTFDFSTANVTASAGSDFDPVSLTGLVIPFGQLSRTVSVTVRGDTVVEADETLRGNISMGNVSILDGVGIGTIANDDIAQ